MKPRILTWFVLFLLASSIFTVAQPTRPPTVPQKATMTPGGYWVMPPSPGCSQEDLGKCGTVYDSKGGIIPGLGNAGLGNGKDGYFYSETYSHDPSADWSDDKEFSGLPGAGQLSIENGKLVLDCGNVCKDRPVEVDPSTGEIRAWTSDGWVYLTEVQIASIPDVQAKRILMAERAAFTPEGKAYTAVSQKAYDELAKEMGVQLVDEETKLKEISSSKYIDAELAALEKELRPKVEADTTIKDKEDYIKEVLAAKKKDLERDVDAQKAKVKALDDLLGEKAKEYSVQALAARRADQLITEAQTIDQQIKAKKELANLNDFPESEKEKLEIEISDLEKEAKEKREEANKLKTEAGLVSATSGSVSSPSSTATPTCTSVSNCQEKLRKKEISPSAAYDAIKQLATQYEAAAALSKVSRDAYIKGVQDKFNIKLTPEGKILSDVDDSKLIEIGEELDLYWYRGSDSTSTLQKEIDSVKKTSAIDPDKIKRTYDDKIKAVTAASATDVDESAKIAAIQKTSSISPQKGESLDTYQKRVTATLNKQKEEEVKRATEKASTSKQKIDSIKSYLDSSGKLRNDLSDSDLGSIASKLGITIDAGESKDSFLKRINAELESKTNPKIVAEKEKLAKDTRDSADSLYWQSTWLDDLNAGTKYAAVKDFGKVISGGFSLVGALGSYRGVSNLLFPDASKTWMEWANSETVQLWADLPGVVAAEVCGVDQSARFITTSSGTYQFVGAISAEKTSKKFPLLCSKNDKDEWTCPKDLVCNDNTYCYKDKNSPKPEEGYFYKITWGVTAPSDEKFTPYVDEAGSAVKLNVYLDTTPLYTRKGVTDPKQVIQLANGAHDGGMIVRYLPTEYNQVCIRFADNGFVKDRGGDDVNEICASIKTSEGGVVEYSQSSRVETISSTSPEVELNI
ncbi:hypothetical protein HYT55_05540 [Candidatus Woesearchaeota archaeon]|nr:hypothetical protein [Candidatus Woesearchaeota archaeon]